MPGTGTAPLFTPAPLVENVFPVRYYCPHCETVVTLQREGYLADKSVTPYPLEGWDYAPVGGDYAVADGIRIVCGGAESGSGGLVDVSANEGVETAGEGIESGDGVAAAEGDACADEGDAADAESDRDSASFDGPGCGEPYYLNFVRFEDGAEVEPAAESRFVTLASGGLASGGLPSPDSPGWPGR
mgnify:CR=1 FL=1